ncbi:PEP-CTERM sorting domain-containing protein [Rhodopirellula sp. MGV]|uniref:PEP-CTERM sorting domain-containing protein n=1 Tax=Rhodopirellula sp. MGV TaxID=2023130 RepID=UPI000B96FF36|nr:PEP-CTERM sorting domain-containing protein [Rhodopirellula sp. MGV]OYP37267.1 hypothetical protein CGZ80_05725 [Rhodopirellula sp. MGV]PNY38060.1 PEP-CTERM sorting domain-containing protein [Rhodopirellula baltica]
MRAGVGILMLAVLPSIVCAGPILHDANVTPDLILGAGNANGGFTVDRDNGIEIGLRGKLRFDSSNQPQNIFNSNGDGTYTFETGQPVGGGFGFAPGSSSTAVWSFDWSINSDFAGLTGNNLDAFEYLMEIDFDPSAGENFLAFDPINVPSPDFADHAIGTNATGNGMGVNAADRTGYLNLLANNNVAQNSWNMEFFDDAGAGFGFNANVDGIYTIRLSALDGGNVVASSSIQVISQTVPEPSSMAIFGFGALGLLVRKRRRS